MHEVKQLFLDYSLFDEITATVETFKTIASQAHRIIDKAVIVGDKTTFTGVANDKIDVSIDGTASADIDIASATDIAGVVTAINAIVSGTPASEDANGFLQILSNTTGSTSVVTISDDGASSGAVDRLFSVSAERTNTGISDLDELVGLTERVNDRIVEIIPYSKYLFNYTDPSANSTNVPDEAARWNNRLYFGPRPSAANLIYIDYIKLLTEVSAGGTLPFENEYDPVLIAKAVRILREWLDPSDASGLNAAIEREKKVTDLLIVKAARNVGMIDQSASRNEVESFGPRVPIS